MTTSADIAAPRRPQARRNRKAKPRTRPGDPKRRPKIDWRIYKELVARSKLEPLAARELLAHSAMLLHGSLTELRLRFETVGLTSDESRTIPATAGKLQVVLRDLGTRLPTPDEEDEDDEDPFGVGGGR